MREYIVSADNLTIVGTNTLAFINPAAGQTLELIRAWASQRGTATSQQVGIVIGTKATAFPTLVSSTPKKIKSSDPASQLVGATTGAAGTSGVNASAEGGGATVDVYTDNFNNLNGFLWTPNFTLGETFMVNSAAALGLALRLTSTPSVLTGWSVGFEFRELG